MDFYLQLGWGMMGHCENLLKGWEGGTVILSPRDLEPEQLINFAGKIKKLKGQVLLDPQVYLPRATHLRLQSHNYWDKEYSTIAFWSGTGLNQQLMKLLELNRQLSCDAFILPGLYTRTVNIDWLEYQRATIESAQSLQDNQFDLIATVALSVDVIKNPDQIHGLIESVKNWSSNTIYLICEPPTGQYLVNDPAWLANVLDLIAGLRLSDKKVILGYCSHQMLIAACACANAIASGTWLNVRSFTTSKFHAQESDDESRRTTWYYCPQALSEFKLPSLDLAVMRGMLMNLKPIPALESNEAKILFSGSQPSSTGFRESESFRHYLQALRTQALASSRSSFDESVEYHRNLLDSAEQILQKLQSVSIRDKARDFEQVIDTNRAALSYIEDYRGVILRRNWSRLA
ncbi:hypothetical protein PI95_029155 [Hassallia byssoidea VB512170]|uniref:Uncharacterized protein n=1 Tax=Hassallia byssoidea VB512170 TaxID=1304833 RepID=A0A846HIG8_9CYAN|nr:hypothetical protein [Hassalia byssoidea]NEU76474.1 hypothetical protein [Hassalia byssoidea VB512170]